MNDLKLLLMLIGLIAGLFSFYRLNVKPKIIEAKKAADRAMEDAVETAKWRTMTDMRVDILEKAGTSISEGIAHIQKSIETMQADNTSQHVGMKDLLNSEIRRIEEGVRADHKELYNKLETLTLNFMKNS